MHQPHSLLLIMRLALHYLHYSVRMLQVLGVWKVNSMILYLFLPKYIAYHVALNDEFCTEYIIYQ